MPEESSRTRLVALKPLRYATRRLQAGDTFEAGYRDARLLIQIKRARTADAEPAADTVRLDAKVEASDADLSGLRAVAAQLGVHVDGRWGEARLVDEIEAARQSRPDLSKTDE